MLSDQLTEVILKEMVGEISDEKCYQQFINEIKKQILQEKEELNRVKIQKEKEIDI